MHGEDAEAEMQRIMPKSGHEEATHETGSPGEMNDHRLSGAPDPGLSRFLDRLRHSSCCLDDGIHSRMAEVLGLSFSSLLGPRVDCALAFVDHTRYDEYVMCVSKPSCSYTFAVQPGEGRAVIDFSMPVAAIFTDPAFDERRNPRRDFPALGQREQAVMAGVAAQALDGFAEAWRSLLNVDVASVQFSGDPDSFGLAEPSAAAVLVAFEVVCDRAAGLITLCYPAATLRALLETAEPLVQAVLSNDTEELQSALSSGMDPNVTSWDGSSALRWAAESGNTEMIRLLLASGAVDTDGSAVACAAYGGNTAALEMLLSSGSTPDAASPFGNPLVLACQQGNTNVIRVLVAAGANPNVEEGRAIESAIEGGHAEVVSFLLSVGAGPATGNHLLTAVRKGNSEIVSHLLASGVNPDLKEEPATTHGTALTVAAESGHEEIVRLLVEAGADREACGLKGDIPLFTAAVQGFAGIFERLAEGEDALLVAILSGEVARVENLLLHRDPNAPISHRSPLAWAISRLVRHGSRDYPASTALDPLQYGSSPPYARREGEGKADAEIYEHGKAVVRALLEAGADPNARDLGDQPLLVMAVPKARRPGHPYGDIVELLLLAGADPNVQDVAGDTAMSRAVCISDARTVGALLDAGADPRLAGNACEMLARDLQQKGAAEVARQNGISLGEMARIWDAFGLPY